MTESGSELRRAGNGKVIEPSPRAGGRRAGHRSLKRFAAFLLFAGSMLLPATSYAQTTTVAGVADGSLAVGPDGSASYSIPIKLPPGIAGMAPSLAIGYSSGSGNGVLGMGWSIGGLSIVHRCAKTLAQDGEIGGVNFDADDRLCLDGQRLVSISGLYGADGTEYRTEIDSFTKVVSYGTAGSGPAKFKAWTKSGQVIEYGFTSDSQVEANGQPEIRFWAANNITDTAGNYLTVSYLEDVTAGSHLVDRIDYAGNAAAGVLPQASVRFSYELRPDISAGFHVGSPTIQDQRLTNIQAFHVQSVVRDYRFTYETGASSGRSRLTSVTECDGADNCLPPTTFAWKPDLAGYTNAPSFELPDVTHNKIEIYLHRRGDFVDLNGDGLADWIQAFNDTGGTNHQNTWLQSDTGWQINVAYQPPFVVFDHLASAADQSRGVFIDVNGDGLPDFLQSYKTSTGTFQTTWLNTGNGWQISAAFQAPFIINDYAISAGGQARGNFVDVNGDGLPDFVQAYENSAGIFQTTWLNTGNGWQTSAAHTAPFVIVDHAFARSSAPAKNHPRVRGEFVDIDGDGLADFIESYQDYVGSAQITWLNTGNGWQQSSHYAPPFVMLDYTFWNLSFGGAGAKKGEFADVNGDGLADWVEAYRGNYHKNFLESRWRESRKTWLNTGKGWVLSSQFALPDFLRLAGLDRASLADVNGDGLPDFVQSATVLGSPIPVPDKVTWLGTHAGWERRTDYDPPEFIYDYSISVNGKISITGTAAELVDVNGDGAQDFVKATTTGTPKATWLANSSVPDLIASVTDSLGTQSSLTFTPATDNSIYEKGSDATFPAQDVQGPFHVVTEVTTDDGVGGQSKTTYAYAEAQVHMQGRGFLGFGRMHATNELTGTTITTHYRHDYPFTGQVSFSETYLSDGTTLKTLSNSYASTTLNGGLSIFPYLTQSVAESYEINHGPNSPPTMTVTMSSSYDGFGNVTSLVVDSSGAGESFVTTTNSTYVNDTAKWFLGRLIRVDVIQQLPDLTTSARSSAFAYDPATGLLSQEVAEPDLPAFKLTTDHTRDVFGNILATTVSGADITTRGTSASYSADGRFPEVTSNALGHSETSVFDPKLGTVVSLTGPNGITTTWNYDGFGRKVREDRADGTATVWEYRLKPPGTTWHEYYVFEKPILAATGATIGPINLTYFDSLNRVTLTRTDGFDGTSVYVNTHYNERGEVSAVSRPYFGTAPAEERQWTTTAYDVIGRPTWVVAPDGGVTSPIYDGLTATTTNALNQTETRTDNAIGQLVQATDNAGTTVSYSYDHHGNLIETNAGGVVTTMDYDIRGRKIAMDDPDMGVWSYAYNVLGELVSQTDAKGQSVTMAYDKLGRMTSRTEPEGTTTWSYDNPIKTAAIGKPDTVTRSQDDYLENYVYDALGRASQTTVIHEGAVYDSASSYDSAGRLAILTYPSGFMVEQGYNAFGYLEEVREFGGAGTVYWRAVDVDAEGRTLEEQLGNGLTTLRDYDPADGLIRSTQVWQGATTLRLNQTFDFDKLGNLTSRGDLHKDREESFTYDNLNRLTGSSLIDTVTLTQLGQTTYAYDALGNLTSKSDVGAYSYGVRPHAVTATSGRIYAYDANGAMTSTASTVTAGTFGGGVIRSVAWSSFNKPVHVTAHNTLGATDLVYGPGRNRIKQTVVKGSAITAITYVGGIFEKHAKVGTSDKLVHFIRAGGTVAIYTKVDDANPATDKTRWLHKDHLGSIAMITREDGSVSVRRSHEAFGLARKGNWEASNNPHNMYETPRGFTGHEHLTSVGLIHMNGRVYDPEIGRFLSADPFVQAPASSQSFNRYSYVNNNPLSFTDPSGFFSFKKFVKKAVKSFVSESIDFHKSMPGTP